MNATRAAVAEGIVAGGGTALLQVQTALSKIKVTGDEKTGVEIVKRAIEEPVRQIAYNAGLEGAVIVDTIKRSRRGFGFNALTEEYVDMIEAGIVDPTKAVSYTHLDVYKRQCDGSAISRRTGNRKIGGSGGSAGDRFSAGTFEGRLSV